MMDGDSNTVRDWLRLIQAEYVEMPALQLTKPEIQRLWNLSPHVCRPRRRAGVRSIP